jgi:hypothetical protein
METMDFKIKRMHHWDYMQKRHSLQLNQTGNSGFQDKNVCYIPNDPLTQTNRNWAHIAQIGAPYGMQGLG